ncbi:MAG: ATPase [Verrucomicrobiaceae bacterium]|nr:MAG: ATPase [Verrucomicrobiaceae bacterium]
MSDCCSNPPPEKGPDRQALRRSLLKLTPPPPAAAVPSCCAPKAPAGDSCCGGGKKGRPDFLLWGSLGAFLAGVAVHFLVPSAPVWLHVFGHACYELMSRAWWGLLIGIAAVAVIGRFPRELVAAVLGRGGSVSGLFRAVGAGVLLDLCNHGILLVGMSLYKRGASLGQTLAFLIASPWNSLSLTLILAALIGWGWMFLFILLSMIVALVTGWIADRLVHAGKIPPNPNAVDLPHDYRIGPAVRDVLRSLKPGAANYLRLAREGLSGSQMILRWIFFGFVLTGLIRAFVPDASFQQYFGPTIAGLFLTLLATTVLEVCSEGSSPIAADLLTRAHAPGNAFVFLMAGAATDYTEIMALRETTRSWKATLALPLISTPQVLLVGWLIHRFAG